MPTRSKIAPGCQVTYIGPHVEGYLPALNIGLVEHVGPTRSRVKYPWGCHSILTDRLAIAGSCAPVAPVVKAPALSPMSAAIAGIVAILLLDLLDLLPANFPRLL